MSPDPEAGGGERPAGEPGGEQAPAAETADTVPAPGAGEADTEETPAGGAGDTLEAPAGGTAEAQLEDERVEIERLRAEVAELKATQPGDHPTSEREGRHHGGLRWSASIALMVLASLLSVVAVVARYARSQLLDTDHYVSTVSPLADNPNVQNAIATQVTNEIFSRLDAQQVTENALSKLTDLGAPAAIEGLATPIAAQVEGFTRSQVETFVKSDQFPKLWDEANRAAHKQVVAVLTGKQKGAVSFQKGAVTVDLGKVVDRVKARLVDRGFKLAERIPEVHSTFTLVQSDQITKAQRATRLLNRVATALPFVIIILGAAAVAVAPNRRRGLLWLALAIAIGMVVLAGGLALVRQWYLNNGTPRKMTPQEAVGVVRTLLAPMRTAMRAVLVLALVVALAAFVTGPSGAARSIRAFVVRLRERAQAGVESGRTPSPVEAWVGAHKRALRIGAIVAGVLVLALWTYPSGAVVLGIVVMVLIALGLIEVFGWSAARPSTPAPS